MRENPGDCQFEKYSQQHVWKQQSCLDQSHYNPFLLFDVNLKPPTRICVISHMDLQIIAWISRCVFLSISLYNITTDLQSYKPVQSNIHANKNIIVSYRYWASLYRVTGLDITTDTPYNTNYRLKYNLIPLHCKKSNLCIVDHVNLTHLSLKHKSSNASSPKT